MITRVPTIDQSDMDFVYGDSDPDQSPRSPLAEVTAEDETQPPAPRPSSSRGLKRSARVCSVETAEDGDEEDCKVPPWKNRKKRLNWLSNSSKSPICIVKVFTIFDTKRAFSTQQVHLKLVHARNKQGWGGGSQYREIPRNFVDSSTAGPADRDRGGVLAAAAGGDGAQHEGRDRGPGPARLRQPRVPLRLAQTLNKAQPVSFSGQKTASVPIYCNNVPPPMTNTKCG